MKKRHQLYLKMSLPSPFTNDTIKMQAHTIFSRKSFEKIRFFSPIFVFFM